MLKTNTVLKEKAKYKKDTATKWALQHNKTCSSTLYPYIFCRTAVVGNKCWAVKGMKKLSHQGYVVAGAKLVCPPFYCSNKKTHIKEFFQMKTVMKKCPCILCIWKVNKTVTGLLTEEGLLTTSRALSTELSDGDLTLLKADPPHKQGSFRCHEVTQKQDMSTNYIEW